MHRQRQLALPGLADSRPAELVVSGRNLIPTIARLQAQGAHVQSVETVRGKNANWRLKIQWRSQTLNKPETKGTYGN